MYKDIADERTRESSLMRMGCALDADYDIQDLSSPVRVDAGM